MSINDLPAEVLEIILSLLSQSERRKSTLISRRLAEVFSSSPFLNDVWLNLCGDSMDEAEAVIANTSRPYKNLRVSEADLFEFNSAIWTKIGESLCKLELIECRWSSEVFYSILEACPNLESLAIDTFDEDISVESFKLPSRINLQNIQASTRNLRHLHLKFFVNAEMLESMLAAMPNISSITLSRFNERSDFLDRLPSMLGASRGITMIDWSPVCGFKQELEQLLRIASTSLREARTPAFFDRNAYEALASCTMLRHLEIRLTEYIRDSLLQDILRNTPQLEVLRLYKGSSHYAGSPRTIELSHEALVPILELTQLRILHLDLDLTTRSDSRASNEFLRNLGRLSSLESLHLSEGIGDVDDTSFCNLESLPNLRDLSLGSLRWNANCLIAFPFNLKGLRQLMISGSRDGEASTLQGSESERTIIGSAICSKFKRLGEEIKSSCLESLEMNDIPLTDFGFNYIAGHQNQLKVLKLRRCNNITDAGLVNLLRQEPLLEKLRIFDWESTDGSFLETLKELCPRLGHLDIRRCAQISRSAVELFKSRRPTISVFFKERESGWGEFLLPSTPSH